MSQEIQTFYKRTKIVATLGPAITQKLWNMEMFNDPKNAESRKKAYENMEAIIKSGVTCVRLNFSHGDHAEQIVRINVLREVANKLHRNIAIMLDTKGPEIRVNKFDPETVTVTAGSTVEVYTKENIIGNATKFSVTDSTGTYNMANDVKKGQLILIDDGKLELKILDVDAARGYIKTVALNTHAISEKRRINLPGSDYSMPFLSDKDRDDIKFACEQHLDCIAASFCNSAANVQEIRDILKQNGGEHIQIISKIETNSAINNLDSIIEASDGIMVARGDLGLEIPYYDVPYWEKQMIRKCRYVGKPVIVATQMLDSLERNIQPTRAEVTDVFFAVERGTDATMLSGESAKGQFPIIAVKTMASIDVKSELLFDYDRAINVYFKKTPFSSQIKKTVLKIAEKVVPSGESIAPIFPYNFLVLFTNDRTLIQAVSNIRPAATIIVVTSDKTLLNAFAINYGIQTYYVEDLNAAKEQYVQVSKLATNIFEAADKPATSIAFFDDKFHEVA